METLSKDNSSENYLCKGKQRNGIGRKTRILIQEFFFKVATYQHVSLLIGEV